MHISIAMQKHSVILKQGHKINFYSVFYRKKHEFISVELFLINFIVSLEDAVGIASSVFCMGF